VARDFHPGVVFTPRDERRVMAMIAVCVAGHAAECVLDDKLTSEGAEADFVLAYSLAGHVSGSDDEVQALVELTRIRVRNELSMPQNWAAVRALAAALVEHSEIGVQRARRVIQSVIDAELRRRR
jgi:hypothetical protein